MMFFGDVGVLAWLIPTLLMVVIWIRTPIFVSARGKRVLLWLKLAILLLLLIALMDPKWPTKTIQEHATVVFLVDVSQSIDRDEKVAALEHIGGICASLPVYLKARIACFDGQFSPLNPEQTEAVISRDRTRLMQIVRETEKDENTDLGPALQEALKMIPLGQKGEVYLFSDGRDTSGGVGDSLTFLTSRRIPVHAVQVPTRKPAERPEIIRVVLPEQVFAGEQVALQALIHHPKGGEIFAEVKGSDQSRVTRTLKLEPGISPLVLDVKAEKPGDVTYTFTVSDLHDSSRLSAYYAMVHVKSLPRVLVFEPEDSAQGRFFRELLAGEKISFQVVTARKLPVDFAAEIRQYPCLVLNNVHRKTFSDEQMRAIKDAVEDGAGLLMLGGHQSFGLGDYTGTPIEDALPVKIPRRTINEPMAIVLVLDRSGSMIGEPWWYLKEAAKDIVKLCKGHYVGIVVFNMAPYWAVPLQQINNPEAVAGYLDLIEPGGGTVFSFALAQAFQALRDLRTTKKSIIMMSDGNPADFGYVVSMLDNFREAQIPVTTIAAGTEVNPYCLKTIAGETGGKYYESLDFARLPEIFREEFKRLSGPPFVEKSIQPVLVKEHAMVRGIRKDEIPPIEGLLLTQTKSRADDILTGPRGEPLLTTWRLGLGRSAVLTTDLLPRWTGKWARWDGLGKMTRQVIKDLSEGAREKRVIFASQKGTRVRLVMDIPPDPSQRILPDSLLVTYPGGRRPKLGLKETSGNRFETTMVASQPGLYPCQILSMNSGPMGEANLPVNQSSEFLPGKVNAMLLEMIAEKSGGTRYEGFEDLEFFPVIGGGEISFYLPLWPFFAVLALLLYLVDIFLRKANVFGISDRSQLADGGQNEGEIFLQLATKFSNLAEEHSLRGEVEEAKRYYLRAKAFFLKAQATREANLMWERYKRFEGK